MISVDINYRLALGIHDSQVLFFPQDSSVKKAREMKSLIIVALIAFAAVSAAPSEDDSKVKFVDGVEINFAAQESDPLDESAIIDAIAKLKQTLVGDSDVKFHIDVNENAGKLHRHARAAEEAVVPVRKERVMARVQEKIAKMKAEGKLPESFSVPENFQLPDHFKVPKSFKVPEGLRLPEKFLQKMNL